jgi:GNAT superfamily N-acetyltransferase
MNARADIAWSRAAQVLSLPGRERVTISAVRPQDADALQAYFRRLSGETRYRRFLGALAELTAKELARLTEMDGPDELMLLAFSGAADPPCLIGEAVLATTPGSTRSEFAISVTDAWQRKGVGAALLRDLECRGANARRRLSVRRRAAHQHRYEEFRPQGGLCAAEPVHRRAADRDRSR